MLKIWKKINQKIKIDFHATNLLREDACSEPCQTPKVELSAITAFKGLKSLTVLTERSTLDA